MKITLVKYQWPHIASFVKQQSICLITLWNSKCVCYTCRSLMGFQSCSKNTTVSAPVRFNPNPPTCVVNSNTSMEGSLLNLWWINIHATHTHTYTHVHTHTHTRTHTYTHVHTYTHMHTHAHTHSSL